MQLPKDIPRALLLVTLSLSIACITVFVCLRLHQLGKDEAQLRVDAMNDAHRTALVAQSETQQTGAAARESIRAVSGATVTAVSQIGALAKTSQGTASASTRLLDATTKGVDLTTHRLDDECPTPSQVSSTWQHCGSLADFNQTLGTVRHTSGQFEIAMGEFNKHDAQYFDQETEVYSTTLDAVQKFDALVSDPNIGKTVANLQAISADGAATVHDGHTWLHAKLYPTKKKGVLNGIDAAGDHVHHWLPSIF